MEINGLSSQVYQNSSIKQPQKSTSNVSKNLFNSQPFELHQVDNKNVFYSEATVYGNLTVMRAENFDENDPTYVVKGKYHGEEYEEAIKVNTVNPKNASRIEMAALQADLLRKGEIDAVVLHPYDINEDGEQVDRSFFDKIDFMGLIGDTYKRNVNNPNYAIVFNLNKVMNSLKSIMSA